ncbi:UDP-glucosyltransferase 2-like [Coccinella septempunctata]|uniref:UDP-glucosyltransferase 2-like n=1 Tax=Coccinella septempunctata TaxID=41139 RepID=UPI001D074B99|nr:UDP-glucosyltransferase 2-like [Coccinella septempunctata]
MEPNENITQIDYHGMYDVFERNNFMSMLKEGYNFFELMSTLLKMLDDMMRYQFTHPGLTELIESNKTFDLMLVEFSLPLWPLLSVKFGCPFIGLSTMDANPGAHAMVGNAVHPALYQYADFGYGDGLTFKERLFSTSFTVIAVMLSHLIFSPLGNDYAVKYLGEGLPDMFEIHRNTSLLFVNSNPVFFSPRPVTPITINLGGGLHLTEPKDLPKVRYVYIAFPHVRF